MILLKCSVCGKKIKESKYSNAKLCSSECFSINFWREIIAEKDKHIIIDGRCYIDGGEVKDIDHHLFLGFSGHRFWIRFFDGNEITTNNLWFQGDVPDKFKNELPDNAKFYQPIISKLEDSVIGGDYH